MTQTTDLQKQETSIKEMFRRIDVLERFEQIIGKKNARQYIGSVLMAVAFKPELQQCTPDSVLKCSLRAAALELSCDESLHQAQLVPYNNRKSGKKEAQLIIHYMGIVNLAQRTGKYKVINYGAIKEGMSITQDPLSGLHAISGAATSKDAKTLGYFAYYKMNNGFERSEYMTVEEIHEHAKKFSPSYHSEYSKWKDAKMLPYLEQKTVIRKLMKTADLSGYAGQALAEALEADDVLDAEAIDLGTPAPMEIKPSAHDTVSSLGFEASNPNPVKDATWNEWLALTERAAKVNVKHSAVERAKTTEDELQMYMQEIGTFVNGAEAQERAGSAESSTAERPYEPATLKAKMQDHAAKQTGAALKGTEAQTVAMNLNECFNGNEDKRKAVLYYLTGKASAKDLDAGWLLALKKWINPQKDSETGKWLMDPMSVKEARMVYAMALKEQGQTTFLPEAQ